jgi:hypothetical protein
MHVETSRSHQVLRDGTERTYERHLLRRSYRDGGKVRKETLANLSHLPPQAIAAVRAVRFACLLVSVRNSDLIPYGEKPGFRVIGRDSGHCRDFAELLHVGAAARHVSRCLRKPAVPSSMVG